MTNITNMATFNQDKKAASFATALVDSIELPEYLIDGLNKMLTHSTNVVFFSGDIEKDQSRRVKSCPTAQVSKAARTQRFSFVQLDKIIRLSFDDDFFYDIYFNNQISTSLLAALLEVLTLEIEINGLTAEMNQISFNAAINHSLSQ